MCLPVESQLLLISLYGAKMVTITNEKCQTLNFHTVLGTHYLVNHSGHHIAIIVSVRALTE